MQMQKGGDTKHGDNTGGCPLLFVKQLLYPKGKVYYLEDL